MIASIFLSFREGFEAALIIGVILSALNKTNRSEYKSRIWYGTGAALALSILIGYLLNRLGASFEGRAEEIFEGVTMILAAAILTWVILWMQSQARATNEKLKSDVQKAVSKESSIALFSIAFLAVIREGVELAFFLTTAAIDSNGTQILTGAILGLVTAVLAASLLFRGLVRLKVSIFFQVTSVILILFAAGLVAHGIHELNEAGVIPSIIEHVWDINHILDENSIAGELLKALVGYNGNPSLLEVIGYLTYFVVLLIVSFTLEAKRKKEPNQLLN